MVTHARFRFEGFVLAGGDSPRFVSNKALANYRGRTMLAHALRALRGLDLDPRIVASDVAPYRRYDAGFVTGERPDLGPVEGVRVALVASSAPWALILSADMPEITSAGLQPLIVAMDDRVQVICYQDDSGGRHPFPGIYHRYLLHKVGWSGRGRTMQEVLDACRVRALSQRDIGKSPVLAKILRNVNCPEDLEPY
jgi:molybdopterin-guanine dinucleotide biosynthesis protein A